MKRLILFTLVIALVLFYFILNFDFFTSIIPGWHTTIYPFWTIGLIVALALAFILLATKILRACFKKNKTL